jgi:hypothetical protein
VPIAKREAEFTALAIADFGFHFLFSFAYGFLKRFASGLLFLFDRYSREAYPFLRRA